MRTFFLIALMLSPVFADETNQGERRAAAPTFSNEQISEIFFPNLDDALPGGRPTISGIRKSVSDTIAKQSNKSKAGGKANAGGWARLISAVSIEDEVKRVKLRYDSVVTSPGAFRGGKYQDARMDLSILATLFAIVSEYSEDVRWKDQAPIARDLLGRSASNCKSGDSQVYNEAKLRKEDLQSLVTGSGLADREANRANQWDKIADRSPLMKYTEQLITALAQDSVDAESVGENSDTVRRRAELLAMLGEVFTKEGMDDAGDEDYESLSRDMSTAARSVIAALDQSDNEAARLAVASIRETCTNCHEQYRN